jgi:plasmid stabilization system protein ParE
MALRVVWSRRARADLRGIVDWISKDSPGNAAAVARRLVARTAGLSDQPGQGRRVPQLDGRDETRELIVHSWRIIYRASDAEVLILAVVHSARLLRNVPPF